MLSKLLKYELKATARTFIPMYIALIIFAIIQRVIGRETIGNFEELNFAGEITTIVIVALFIALVVITIVVVIQRFYKNLLRDEGYLMMTLPVSTRKLILSKLLATFVWIIGSIGTAVIVILILFAGYGDFLKQLQYIFSQMITMMVTVEREYMLVFILFGCSVVVGSIANILLIYLALAMSQFSFAHKYRIPTAIISFIVFNMIITQIAVGVTSLCFSIGIIPILQMSITLVISILLVIVLFEAINWILNKRLNLE
ncbi:MAG: hypothetical protein ACRC1P_08745 [Cellulosilyticaceae bacterium]